MRADVALDESGRSRGYGTVKFATEAQAMNAIRTLNGADIEGRILTVRMDKYQERDGVPAEATSRRRARSQRRRRVERTRHENR